MKLSRQRLQRVGAMGGLTPYRPPNQIIYTDDFPSLTGWTASSGVTVSGGTATFTDVDSTSLSLYRIISTIPTTKPFIVEINESTVAGQKMSIGLARTVGTTTVASAAVNNANGQILLSSQGQGATAYTPTNWDYTKNNKLIIWCDPVNKIVRFYFYWQDTSTQAGRMEQIGSDKVWSYTDAVTSLNFATGGAATGIATIDTLKIYYNWGIIIGDSIATGHPSYDPIPSFYAGLYLTVWPYSIDSHIDINLSNNVRVLNQGIGSQNTSNVLARYQTMILNVAPKYAFFVVGSNDAYAGTTMATSQSNLATALDACYTAGIACYVWEIPPRNNFDTTMATWATTWNAALPAYCVIHHAQLVKCWNAMVDPANSPNLLPVYTDDNIHPNNAGYTIMAQAVLNILRPPLS